MPVRFGTGPTLFSAMTGNVSESGLFVMTLVPFDPGTGVRVLLDLDVGPIGLQGKVVWKREKIVLGRPGRHGDPPRRSTRAVPGVRGRAP